MIIVVGISPYNSNIFTDEDFLSAYVTDRPLLEHQDVDLQPRIPSPVVTALGPVLNDQSTPGPSHDIAGTIVTPEQLRPFPKAPPKKSTVNRRKGSSRILTATPVKKMLDMELGRRAEIKQQKDAKKNMKRKKTADKSDPIIEKAKRKKTADKSGLVIKKKNARS